MHCTAEEEEVGLQGGRMGSLSVMKLGNPF